MPRGMPQIEVSFDLDANGILNVSAAEKSTGKSEKITITNDKGRLSAEDIERMVQEAERCKEEDDKIKESIENRSNLENYMYSVKNQINGELKEGVPEEDRNNILEKVKELERELEDRTYRDKDYYEGLRKELDDMMQAVLMKKTASSDSSGDDVKMPAAADVPSEPTIEEVD